MINNLVLKGLELGPIGTNCYIIGDSKSKSAFLIDASDEADKIIRVLKELKLNPLKIITTHGHADHIGAISELKKKSTGIEFIMHKADCFLLPGIIEWNRAFGINKNKIPEPDGYLEDGQILKLGSLKIKVIHTPGHSPGGVSFYIEETKIVFVGDLIFSGSIGRTDLPGANYNTLKNSIKTKIITLGDNVKIYSGHGPETSVGTEKRENPFFGVRS